MKCKTLLSLALVAVALVGCKPATSDAPSSGVGYWDALTAANAAANALIEDTGKEFMVFPVKYTGSMKPAFDGNAILVVEMTKEFTKGDWVLFTWRERGNIQVVHRVYDDNPFVVKGLANAMPDSGVPREAVWGRVVAVFYSARRSDRQ